ncbi:S41 family peptidase [Plebeiibacterium sediminum]|uniref:S41 family peptidase n=1 Tax=Plebeiibacterium sediminum TaxID=2992112 RepID=A0AAE3M862_9BACT|nr:S41 family peptidase [Plebeiobacterium sediminum]MCW3788335.1 S41 family peptidase [Plebeiobacterium sediminum]
MKNLILLTLLFACLTAFSQNNEKTDWNADIEYIKVELPKCHYNLYMLKSEQDFYNGLDDISKIQDQLSDFEVAVKLQQLIATFGDSHTNLSLNPFLDYNKILPIGLMWFSDGLWVQSTTKSNETILGAKLIEINGYVISEIIDSLSTISAIDNQASVKTSTPKIIPVIQFLEYFGFVAQPEIKLTLEKDGETLEYLIHPEQMNRNNVMRVLPNPTPLCYQNTRLPFWSKVLTKENVFYIQYNKCWSREYPPSGYKGDIQKLPSFSDFHKAIVDSIQQNDYDKVVFDFRFNGGGNSYQGTKLIEELSTIDKLKSKGNLYVITGRDSYSSAIINIMDFKNKTNAILVGEETSGKPNHLGEIRSFKLPSSALILQYSTKYFKQTDKDLKTITPDKEIEPSFTDFKNGYDPIFEWILKQ